MPRASFCARTMTRALISFDPNECLLVLVKDKKNISQHFFIRNEGIFGRFFGSGSRTIQHENTMWAFVHTLLESDLWKGRCDERFVVMKLHEDHNINEKWSTLLQLLPRLIQEANEGNGIVDHTIAVEFQELLYAIIEYLIRLHTSIVDNVPLEQFLAKPIKEQAFLVMARQLLPHRLFNLCEWIRHFKRQGCEPYLLNSRYYHKHHAKRESYGSAILSHFDIHMLFDAKDPY